MSSSRAFLVPAGRKASEGVQIAFFKPHVDKLTFMRSTREEEEGLMTSIPDEKPKVLSLVAFHGRRNLVRSEARTIRSQNSTLTGGVGTVPSLTLLLRLGNAAHNTYIDSSCPRASPALRLTPKRPIVAPFSFSQSQIKGSPSTSCGTRKTALHAVAPIQGLASLAGPARQTRKRASRETAKLSTSPSPVTLRCQSHSLGRTSTRVS